MTDKEYQDKKRECWEEYVNMLNRNCATRYVFDKIFDRAYALGKQEKDAEEIFSLEEEIHTYAKICSFTEADYTAVRKAVEHGISLAKSKTAEDTVIQGWAVRDKCGSLWVYDIYPSDRGYNYWAVPIEANGIALPQTALPDITWEAEPEHVGIIIKRKKNG